MSIIYNALQKTQRNLGNRRFEPKREKIWVDILLVAIIACLLIIIVFAYFPKIKNLFAKHTQPTAQKVVAIPQAPIPAPLIETDYQGSLVLNGIFISTLEKVALINNQSMHVGDMVDGKKIIAIEINRVKLQDKNNIFIMHTVT